MHILNVQCLRNKCWCQVSSSQLTVFLVWLLIVCTRVSLCLPILWIYTPILPVVFQMVCILVISVSAIFIQLSNRLCDPVWFLMFCPQSSIFLYLCLILDFSVCNHHLSLVLLYHCPYWLMYRTWFCIKHQSFGTLSLVSSVGSGLSVRTWHFTRKKNGIILLKLLIYFD